MNKYISEAAFDVLGKRWTGLIIKSLMKEGNRHYMEIIAEIPELSYVMLSKRITVGIRNH
ncbi:DNA-binding HxlR family transcriptional regulator [Paenibacillus sp. V4I3]|uniref:winged helix-turn-helix transcriptional regulator n=1 Tax=unclassified Paenibacillus TaxID=185978 RepID=UPI002788E272|nr:MULTISPECIES: winged helix-turn-helix transcriptional regulator [unclassified Paenibacillus]MDQ0878791.1 DNA-binding HxlR family transcriptional regulator [Paenibacillus sp. V4I3]MDQ0885357.1 DNA-binding HxlR family transcriptional regulator [Paenibacillus sp. V4I9]